MILHVRELLINPGVEEESTVDLKNVITHVFLQNKISNVTRIRLCKAKWEKRRKALQFADNGGTSEPRGMYP